MICTIKTKNKVVIKKSIIKSILECIYIHVVNIEITSWKARAYGIFTLVGEVSEIGRVSAANE